jgi:hypothetical protein
LTSLTASSSAETIDPTCWVSSEFNPVEVVTIHAPQEAIHPVTKDGVGEEVHIPGTTAVVGLLMIEPGFVNAWERITSLTAPSRRGRGGSSSPEFRRANRRRSAGGRRQASRTETCSWTGGCPTRNGCLHSASNDASMSKVLGLGPSKCTRKPSFPGWPVTRGMRKEKQYLSSATGLPRLTRSPPDGCQGVPDANDGLGFII